MLDRKYDNAVTEGMAHCARDPQIQNALADKTPDCIIVPGIGLWHIHAASQPFPRKVKLSSAKQPN